MPDTPSCKGHPEPWDLDTVDLKAWLGAIQACWSCPVLDQCRADRDTQYPHKTGPRAVIWAATAYNDHGRVLTAAQLRRRAFTHPARRRAAS